MLLKMAKARVKKRKAVKKKGRSTGKKAKSGTKHGSILRTINSEIHKQSTKLKEKLGNIKHVKDDSHDDYHLLGVSGLDTLLVDGVMKGAAILVAGGTGTGNRNPESTS